MDRIAEFWRWLPVFRAVAEEEHLTRASEGLGVSPSAVSRGIALLEESVGVSLFDRRGRRLALTRSGRALLEATRSAMRLVHDGLLTATASTFSGSTRVSAPRSLAPVLARALRSLQERHPSLEPKLVGADEAEVTGLLLRGELDVALVRRPQRRAHIAVRRVGNVTNGVYCGPGHPLFDREPVAVGDLAEHPFVELSPWPSAAAVDPWPPERERRVAFGVDDVFVAVAVCAGGGLLAALPDILVSGLPSGPPLRRLAVDIVPPTPVYALRRVQLTERDLAETLIDVAQQALAEVARVVR